MEKLSNREAMRLREIAARTGRVDDVRVMPKTTQALVARGFLRLSFARSPRGTMEVTDAGRVWVELNPQ